MFHLSFSPCLHLFVSPAMTIAVTNRAAVLQSQFFSFSLGFRAPATKTLTCIHVEHTPRLLAQFQTRIVYKWHQGLEAGDTSTKHIPPRFVKMPSHLQGATPDAFVFISFSKGEKGAQGIGEKGKRVERRKTSNKRVGRAGINENKGKTTDIGTGRQARRHRDYRAAYLLNGMLAKAKHQKPLTVCRSICREERAPR